MQGRWRFLEGTGTVEVEDAGTVAVPRGYRDGGG